MTRKRTRIELGGQLGRVFGKVHYRNVSTPKEAARALCCTIPGFEKYMNTSHQRGLLYQVFKGRGDRRRDLAADDLTFPGNGEPIRIMPVIAGSKRAGVFQTILGAVVVAVGAVVTYFGGGAIGVPMMKIGAAMMLGGVAQMLSPQTGGLASKQDADNQASYAFGGVTNTASQGYPVPVLYGKRAIGGAIISAGIYVEDKQ